MKRMRSIKNLLIFFLATTLAISCGDDDDVSFALQEISAPTDVDALFDIAQDGSGQVTVTPAGVGASGFEVFFGDVDDETPTTVAPGETVEHTYGEGEFTLRIVAIGATGLTSELNRVVSISLTPPSNLEADIIVSDTNPLEITVSPTAENATVFDILFGDEEEGAEPFTIMNGETADHIYAAAGEFTVTIVARGAGAATITLTETITVSDSSANIALPITFDDASIDYTLATFGGASFEVVDNPDLSGANTEASLVGAITNSGTQFEGGAFNLGTPVDFSGDNKTITMKFWSTSALPVLLKFEGGVNGDERQNEVVANHGGTGWEELSFDFATDATQSFIDGNQGVGEPFVPTGSYATMVIFVDGPGMTAGTFFIDDITQLGVEATDGGPIEGAVSLLFNGDFEAGAEPWNAGVEAFDGPPAPIVTENGNTFYSVNIENPDPDQPFLVNLSQQGLSLVADTNYILTFDAWSDGDRTIIAGIGESSGNFASVSVDVNLTAAMQKYTINLTTVGFGGDDIRVLFDSNGAAGLVNIDNVSLVEGGDGSDTGGGPIDGSVSLLVNGDFEAGAEPWNAGVEAFDGPPAPVVTENDNTFYSVSVDNPDPGQPFLVNLSQQGLSLAADTNYVLTFNAWSDVDRTIIAGIGESSGGFASVSVDVNLTTVMQKYTINLTTAGFGGDDLRVLFDSNGAAGTVNIDNVSLVEGGDGSNTP